MTYIGRVYASFSSRNKREHYIGAHYCKPFNLINSIWIISLELLVLFLFEEGKLGKRMNMISPEKDFGRNSLFVDEDLSNEHDKSRKGLEEEFIACRWGSLAN